MIKYEIIFVIIFLLDFLCVHQSIASVLKTVSFSKNSDYIIVNLDFDIIPIYTIFSLHHPERIVLDILNISKIQKNIFPVNYNSINNLIRCVRISAPTKNQSIRMVLDLMYVSNIKSIAQKKMEKNYRIVLTISKNSSIVTSNTNVRSKLFTFNKGGYIHLDGIINNPKKIVDDQSNKKKIGCQNQKKSSIIVVAIDAGHGGQDPGATGCRGIYEKYVTISIAKKLKILLDSDPVFRAVLVRDGDYFLSVVERSNVARKKGANILVSIHADSSLNSNIRGASVWVLSNQRVKTEMTYWLRSSEKYSELLGGVSDILINHRGDPYFNHLVLDLQFGHSKRVGYDIAVHMLNQLKNISILHKNVPEYSSFGVLRAPDIPSILVETGFISNMTDAGLLASSKYQEQLAIALYKGLRSYFII